MFAERFLVSRDDFATGKRGGRVYVYMVYFSGAVGLDLGETLLWCAFQARLVTQKGTPVFCASNVLFSAPRGGSAAGNRDGGGSGGAQHGEVTDEIILTLARACVFLQDRHRETRGTPVLGVNNVFVFSRLVERAMGTVFFSGENRKLNCGVSAGSS